MWEDVWVTERESRPWERRRRTGAPKVFEREAEFSEDDRGPLATTAPSRSRIACEKQGTISST
jgi:hypothetical protein